MTKVWKQVVIHTECSRRAEFLRIAEKAGVQVSKEVIDQYGLNAFYLTDVPDDILDELNAMMPSGLNAKCAYVG